MSLSSYSSTDLNEETSTNINITNANTNHDNIQNTKTDLNYDDDEEEDDFDYEQDDEHKVLDLSIKSTQQTNKRKKKPIKTLILHAKMIDDEPEQEAEPEQELVEPEQEELLDYIDTSSINEEIDYSASSIQNTTFQEDEEEIKQEIKKKPKSIKSFPVYYQQQQQQQQTVPAQSSSKKQMRFQCRFCIYKSHSVSLMQNHIYRHIDTTPYSCYYCGHKSTTKSTIMVHIELCHPNMEVKIKESRVKEEDYYIDLNSTTQQQQDNSALTQIKDTNKQIKKFEIIPNKCKLNESASITSSPPSLSSSSSSICSSPSVSPAPSKQLELLPIHSEEDLNDKDGNNYVTVFNRPKQYFGSLYEPDKQYSCKLCTYTTNHKPSMEDHVYVHTNKRPYRCGYCNEEIYTRYAATYHNKYKHPGEARNFIKDEQDVSVYYVNRAKKSTGTNESDFKNSDNNDYGVVAQHKVLDSKQRQLSPEPCNNNNNNSKKKVNNNNNNNNNNNKSKMLLPPPPAPAPLPDSIKITSFKAASPVQSTKKHKKTDEQIDNFNNYSQSPFLAAAAAAAFNPKQANNTPTAAALTQLMLSNALNVQNSSLLTSSPTSSTSSSSSSSSSTSPLLNNNITNQLYDFNLAIKMYQIQFQNLMAANYLQHQMRGQLASGNQEDDLIASNKRKLNDYDDKEEPENDLKEDSNDEHNEETSEKKLKKLFNNRNNNDLIKLKKINLNHPTVK